MTGRPLRGAGLTSMLVVLVGGLLVTGSGCAVFWLGAGAAGGVAGTMYVNGKLQTEVDASVPQVEQAAVASLRDLELPVEQREGDHIAAEVKSKTADGKPIWIHVASTGRARSQVTIRVGYLGNEGRSRRILDAMTAQLRQPSPG